MSTYTVQPGDTLPGIAKIFLGDPGRWREIQLYNQSHLVNPASFAPGMVLRLPPGAAIPAPVAPASSAHGGASASSPTAGAGVDVQRPRRLRVVARSGRRTPFSRR